MSYEERTRGALFLNRQRQGQQPDWRGDIVFTREMVDNLVELARSGGEIKAELAAWNKKSEKAGTWLSVSISPQRRRNQEDRPRNPARQAAPQPVAQPRGQASSRQRHDDLDDEIPF